MAGRTRPFASRAVELLSGAPRRTEVSAGPDHGAGPVDFRVPGESLSRNPLVSARRGAGSSLHGHASASGGGAHRPASGEERGGRAGLSVLLLLCGLGRVVHRGTPLRLALPGRIAYDVALLPEHAAPRPRSLRLPVRPADPDEVVR